MGTQINLVDRCVDFWPSDWWIVIAWFCCLLMAPVVTYAARAMLMTLGYELPMIGFIGLYFFVVLAILPMLNVILLLSLMVIEKWQCK